MDPVKNYERADGSDRRMGGGFHPVKKYERADGSVEPTADAIRGDGPHTPIDIIKCSGAFQIYEIKVLRGQSESAQMYGKIKLIHPEGNWKLYKRHKNNAETIKVPGPIELMLPQFCVEPDDPIGITFHFDTDSEFKEMNNKYVMWDPDRPYVESDPDHPYVEWDPDHPRDEFLFRTLRGEESTMEVSFIVISKAILADIEIYLDNIADGEGIFGTIKAFFSKKFQGLKPFLVFNKKPNDPVHVKAGKPIPLVRPFIAVPHENGLVIDVNLHTVSDTLVAGGKISFCPDKFGKWFGVLGNEDGEIQVRANVAFCPYMYHGTTQDASEALRKLEYNIPVCCPTEDNFE